MGPNNLDMCIPMYAAFYTGVVVSPIDPAYKITDFQAHFLNCKPKLIFCSSISYENVKSALKNIKSEVKVVQFESNGADKFMEEYGDTIDVEQFRAVDLNPEENNSFLFPTSGTTGLPKYCVITQQRTTLTLPYIWSRFENFPSPIKMALLWAPVQWNSAIHDYIHAPIYRYTRLQTSNTHTVKEFCTLVNFYKNVTSPDCCVEVSFGMTEVGNWVFYPDHKPKGSIGSPHPGLQYMGYLNNEKATDEVFSGDGWLKTGDIIYKDEHYYFYFVDRLKILINYMGHTIYPSELESVIRNHSGVLDVAITCVPHTQYGELPVICVVSGVGSTLTTQDIKDVVRDVIPEVAQVKCEVIFIENIPMMATTKIDRRKIKAIAMNMIRG